MKNISLDAPNAYMHLAVAFLSSGVIASTIYGVLTLGLLHPLALLLVVIIALIFTCSVMVPLFFITYFLKRRTLWDVLILAPIATATLFFSDHNVFSMCSGGTNFTINQTKICIDGVITKSGWILFGENIAQGFFIGLVGAIIFWWMVPKTNKK